MLFRFVCVFGDNRHRTEIGYIEKWTAKEMTTTHGLRIWRRGALYLIMIIGWSFPYNLSIRSNLSIGTCAPVRFESSDKLAKLETVPQQPTTIGSEKKEIRDRSNNNNNKFTTFKYASQKPYSYCLLLCTSKHEKKRKRISCHCRPTHFVRSTFSKWLSQFFDKLHSHRWKMRPIKGSAYRWKI